MKSTFKEMRSYLLRNGYNIDTEAEVEKPRKKSVSFSNFDEHYYVYY